MMHGFYFNTPNKEYFFVTKQTERTKELCKAVEKYLVEDGCKFGESGIKDNLQLATCQVKHTAQIGVFCVIKGENFVKVGKPDIISLKSKRA